VTDLNGKSSPTNKRKGFESKQDRLRMDAKRRRGGGEGKKRHHIGAPHGAEV